MIIISGPIGLLVGRKISKKPELKIWHIWLATSVSCIGLSSVLLTEFLVLFGPLGIIAFILLFSSFIIFLFHTCLKYFVPATTLNDSFLILFSMSVLLVPLVFVSIILINRSF